MEDARGQATRWGDEYTPIYEQETTEFLSSLMKISSYRMADFSDLTLEDFHPKWSSKAEELCVKWDRLKEKVRACVRDLPESKPRLQIVALFLLMNHDYHSGLAFVQGCESVSLKQSRKYQDLSSGRKYNAYIEFFWATRSPAIHYLTPLLLKRTAFLPESRNLASRVCWLPTAEFTKRPASCFGWPWVVDLVSDLSKTLDSVPRAEFRPERNPTTQHKPQLDSIPRAQLRPERNPTTQHEPQLDSVPRVQRRPKHDPNPKPAIVLIAQLEERPQLESGSQVDRDLVSYFDIEDDMESPIKIPRWRRIRRWVRGWVRKLEGYLLY